MKKVLCDTNIFIHYFNGNEKTSASLNEIGLEHVIMPAVTAMELFRGMSNKNE